jgi:hypothetical protein
MKLTSNKSLTQDKTIFVLEIGGEEQASISLDRFDVLLLNECNKNDSIADKLLALETIARKIEQTEAD